VLTLKVTRNFNETDDLKSRKRKLRKRFCRHQFWIELKAILSTGLEMLFEMLIQAFVSLRISIVVDILLTSKFPETHYTFVKEILRHVDIFFKYSLFAKLVKFLFFMDLQLSLFARIRRP